MCDGDTRCPLCKQVRSRSEMQMSIIGSVPIVCKTCRPGGVRHVIGGGGSGVVFYTDDPEVSAALGWQVGP